MKIDANTITNFLSGFSLIISTATLFFYYKDRKKLKYAISNKYKKQLLCWHSETVEILIKLRACQPSKKDENLAKLSVQIEKGRFYFPNIDKGDGFGKDKPVAYQGYRNLTLEFLVYSYNLFKKEEYQKISKYVEVLQKEFTSNVFEIVRPKENLEEIKRLTDKFYASENIFEDFLKNNVDGSFFNRYR